MEGLEERFEIATLWSAFFGMEHRATKWNAVVGRWGEGEWAEDRRWTDGGVGEVVRVRDLHAYEGTAEKVPIKGGNWCRPESAGGPGEHGRILERCNRQGKC